MGAGILAFLGRILLGTSGRYGVAHAARRAAMGGMTRQAATRSILVGRSALAGRAASRRFIASGSPRGSWHVASSSSPSLASIRSGTMGRTVSTRLVNTTTRGGNNFMRPTASSSSSLTSAANAQRLPFARSTTAIVHNVPTRRVPFAQTSTQASSRAPLLSGAARKAEAIRMRRFGGRNLNKTRIQHGRRIKTRHAKMVESAGDTTIKMQKANRNVLKTIGQGISRTGKAIKRGVVRSAKAIKRAGRHTAKWAKKHRTPLILSTLATAGVGGVGGAIQGVADYNAAKRDNELLSAAAKTAPAGTSEFSFHGGGGVSSGGTYANSYLDRYSGGGGGGGGGGGDTSGGMYKQRRSLQFSSLKKKRSKMVRKSKSRRRKSGKGKRKVKPMSSALKKYLRNLRRGGASKYKQRKSRSTYTGKRRQKRLAF
jgi:hypothetical protein